MNIFTDYTILNIFYLVLVFLYFNIMNTFFFRKPLAFYEFYF